MKITQGLYHVNMMYSLRDHKTPAKGFALVVTLSLMILLTVIAVGLLTLSTISLRSAAQGSSMAEARANARLALMVALGELQKEMGPDMRISSESALLDDTPNTEEINGVAQARWLGCYNSWGDWLNASYAPPGSSGPLKISDTYTTGREKMFRRWLLSLPEGMETKTTAPVSVFVANDPSWVDMVGNGSLGQTPKAGDATRAYLTSVGKTGKYAWWIGPENHKARIDKANNPRTLTASKWQESQGDTTEVGIGALDGFDKLDATSDLGTKLITHNTLRAAEIEQQDVEKHFFDLTAHSQGVLASVRTGHLKKDLSLLFEKDASSLPAPYKFNQGTDIREPSIRPMSKELADKKPKVSDPTTGEPIRHFASWTNMRHYYRMYRQPSDATLGGAAGTGGTGSVNWSGNSPWTDMACKISSVTAAGWKGENHYWRVPILAKITFIYSLQTEAINASNHIPYLVYTPVLTFWNPYNVELRIPNSTLRVAYGSYQCLPLGSRYYLGNTVNTLREGSAAPSNAQGFLESSGGGPIVFKPGEMKIFSPSRFGVDAPLIPGFNPLGISGGDRLDLGPVDPSTKKPSGVTFTQNPGLSLNLSHPASSFNINYGSTPGSFMVIQDWISNANRIPRMYQHDWFQKEQQFTPITNDPRPVPDAVGGIATVAGNIEKWIFDGVPLPIAYAQLVLKTSSDFDYFTIAASNPSPNNWRKDWRCRNWIQAPPQYFGSSTYLSEDTTTAHTQRMDSPYIMNFGPLSNLSEAVALVDPSKDTSKAVLGSGPNAVEQINRVSVSELPTAPLGSLAGFAGMRINPGWYDPAKLTWLKLGTLNGSSSSTIEASLYAADVKASSYQSGVTGPGIGNSFMHPILPRDDVYRSFDNSKSQDPVTRNKMKMTDPFQENNNLVFNDYWDHVFLLNDSLWDDYFVSSLADQTRGGQTVGESLEVNLQKLANGEELANSRLMPHLAGRSASEIKQEFLGTAGKPTDDGYLKAAARLMINGMFNVNSTSVSAWFSLFAGIRERQLVYRDDSGTLRKIDVPSGKRIAVARFDTEISDKEVDDPSDGVIMPDGSPGWSGVRFLDDNQVRKLAEECVKQVKLRGPFLNFAEFINRRLLDNDLGTMGALQSAIDYDDNSPDSQSINFRFKNDPDFLINTGDLGTNSYQTPQAAVGSRFAGIPGYVIQSDLLKPIANTLSVRDDTFRIRAYGESLAGGKVIARAWCETVVQRVPEYQDSSDGSDEASRVLDATGNFKDTTNLSTSNIRFGRKFRIESFRWLNASEI